MIIESVAVPPATFGGKCFRCSQVVWAVEVNEAKVSKPVPTLKAATLQAPATTAHAVHIHLGSGQGLCHVNYPQGRRACFCSAPLGHGR